MVTMKVSMIGTRVKVEIKDVTVKYSEYNSNFIVKLRSKFKEVLPDKLIINHSESWIFSTFLLDLIEKEGIQIDADGNITYPKLDKSPCFNTVEQTIQDELDYYTLIVDAGYDYNNLVEILLHNGYILSTDIDKGKAHVNIHGKK